MFSPVWKDFGILSFFSCLKRLWIFHLFLFWKDFNVFIFSLSGIPRLKRLRIFYVVPIWNPWLKGLWIFNVFSMSEKTLNFLHFPVWYSRSEKTWFFTFFSVWNSWSGKTLNFSRFSCLKRLRVFYVFPCLEFPLWRDFEFFTIFTICNPCLKWLLTFPIFSVWKYFELFIFFVWNPCLKRLWIFLKESLSGKIL